ncbi:hypothetical protein [Sneathiella sp.]|uniref:hypothetical protein n=1 Tax=Sneathiella sp. TaxID=1964365 RepID=UPI002FDFAFDC
MTALTNGRPIEERAGILFTDPVAAAKKIYAGALVCLDASGNATPGAVSATLKARGVARETVDNSAGGAGAATVTTAKGIFPFANSADTDEITRADIGGTAYIVDDQTVAKTHATNARSAAGKIMDIDEYGVWVKID